MVFLSTIFFPSPARGHITLFVHFVKDGIIIAISRSGLRAVQVEALVQVAYSPGAQYWKFFARAMYETALVMSSMIRRPLSLLLDAHWRGGSIQQGTLRPPIILYRFVTLEDGIFLLEQILNSRRLLCLVRRLLGALKHCILSS